MLFLGVWWRGLHRVFSRLSAVTHFLSLSSYPQDRLKKWWFMISFADPLSCTHHFLQWATPPWFCSWTPMEKNSWVLGPVSLWEASKSLLQGNLCGASVIRPCIWRYFFSHHFKSDQLNSALENFRSNQNLEILVDNSQQKGNEGRVIKLCFPSFG